MPTETVSVPQLMMGSRLMDIPGARMRKSVTMKLIEPRLVEIPRKMFASA